MINHYILDKDKNVIPATMEEWGEFFEKPDRYLFSTKFENSVTVSTVFVGLPLGFTQDKENPLLFETMIFNGEYDGHEERYSSYELAKQGHYRMVEALLKGRSPQKTLLTIKPLNFKDDKK